MKSCTAPSCDIGVYFRKKPNPSGSFQLMEKWDDVPHTKTDDAAKALYDRCEGQEHKSYCDLKSIRSKDELLAFLRYDYKKVLLRARYVYIDRLIDPNTMELTGGELDHAYFEPIFLCFPNLEFIGRLLFTGEIEWYVDDPKTGKILRRMLKQMGNGYTAYAEDLVQWHRHALAHEMRPDGKWRYDLNTKEGYNSPKWGDDGKLYLNIPHFMDSCLFKIEEVCEQLTGNGADVMLRQFQRYVEKRFSNTPRKRSKRCCLADRG